MDQRKILAGFHDEMYLHSILMFSNKDVRIEGVGNLDEMIYRANTELFHGYVMDANLGYPNSININPSIQMYKLVKQRVEKGLARFIAMSCNEQAVEIAQASPIPVMMKEKFRIWDFIEGVQQLSL